MIDEEINLDIINIETNVSSGPNDNELSDLINELISYINNIKQINLSIDINISRDKNLIYEQYIETEKNNSLLLLNPDLSNEWHPTKNGKLLPEHVTASSNKKVWWLCSKGHEWQSVINSRNKGVGCPYCTGNKPIPGYNDLKTINPIIASQWHMTKNGELKPEDFTISSNKKVWWQCEKGHEWEALIYTRSSGCGCPYCSGQRVISGENDLATINPKLAKEWHPTKNNGLTPEQVMPGSNKKVWWKCKNGHEWQATISSRNSGRGCPYCSGQKVLSGYNDLFSLNPELSKEWSSRNNKLPSQVTLNSNEKVWWKCEKGHEWEASPNQGSRALGCPYCSNQKVLKGYNDLATLNIELAKQWNYSKNKTLYPTDVVPGSNKKVWWKCEKGHEWEAVISSRNKGCGCPLCYRILKSNVNKK